MVLEINLAQSSLELDKQRTMSISHLYIDLDHPPEARFTPLKPFADSCQAMLKTYSRDLGGLEQFKPYLGEYAENYLLDEHLLELRGLAKLIEVSFEELCLTNLYYDAMSYLLGCTAFAVDTPEGPLHARNLDWWSPEGRLATDTICYHFQRGGETLYSTVGWPGYTGALSGMAPGRFSISLNAVLSEEMGQPSMPIASRLRHILETAESYQSAVDELQKVPLGCSALLLVAGTQPGEMCVIERTPSRNYLRGPEQGRLLVTNDFLGIDPDRPKIVINSLQETSCHRFDRCLHLLRDKRDWTTEHCFKVLSDSQVKMQITMQQMVFSARRELAQVQLPQ